MTPWTISVIAATATLLLFASCEMEPPPPLEDRTSDALDRLEQQRRAQAQRQENLPADSKERHTRVYQIPPHLAKPASDPRPTGVPGDPFADNSAPGDRFAIARLKLDAPDAREQLERIGVEFGARDSAIYDAATQQLTINQTPDGFLIIEDYFGYLEGFATAQISTRIEIIEIPTRFIPELSETSAKHMDHTPEWRAVVELAAQGEARVVTSLGTTSPSGQRAMITDSLEFTFPDSSGWNAKARLPEAKESYYHPVGSELEVVAALGIDGKSVELELTLTHHSAPPTLEMVYIETGENTDDANRLLPAMARPIFHAFTLHADLDLLDGETRLLATWRPTGKARYVDEDLMMIAFLKAHVLRPRIQRIR